MGGKLPTMDRGLPSVVGGQWLENQLQYSKTTNDWRTHENR